MSGRSKRRTPFLAGKEAPDYRLIVSVIFLLMIGCIMVFSASSATSGVSLLKNQIVYAALGLFMMFLLSRINYHFLVKLSLLLYVIAVAGLALVRVPGIGYTSHGASRWIEIFGVTIQPAEFMKFAIILLMAYLLTKYYRRMRHFGTAVFILIPGAAACLLILVLTSNLSTAIIVAGITLIMFFIAYPTKKIWRAVIILLVLVALALAVYYRYEIQPAADSYSEQVTTEDTTDETADSQTSDSGDSLNYRQRRILAWLYPDRYPDDSMQSRYSLYAIGFGGLFGRGLGNGIMKYYLPEPTNDFIFAVIGEELGLVGCIMVIVLFIYQIWRIMSVAMHAPDKTGSFVAMGVGIHIALQVIFNIGVATSVFPNTGISLPFISSGGSALIMQLLEMGLVMNVSRQIPGRRKVEVVDENGNVIAREGDIVKINR